MKTPTVTNKALGLLPALPAYFRTYNLLKKSQWWDRRRLEEYQLRQLGRLLEHAYNNVPYYRRVFDERGLKPAHIQDLDDLRKLPFLTRDLVRDNLKDLTTEGYPPGRLEYVTTGGSTGVPLGFYYEKGVSRAREWAFIKMLWGRVGYNFRDRCVIIKGNVVSGADRGQFWEKTLFGRWLVLSSYHLTDENMPRYIEEIRRFRPRFIQAFPSAISILARYMKKNGCTAFESVRAVLCGSENMYPGQRELLEEVLKCRVYTWYGHAERAVLAGECEPNREYHLFPEYGITEIVREDGEPVAADNEVGVIVGTGLTNFAMPLIRYKTDDMAARVAGACACRREYPRIRDVRGRWLQEFIITRNNRPISITAINMHSDVFDNVDRFQFYQDRKEEVVFNVVRKPTFTDRDTEYIRSELSKKLGPDIDLVIRFVDDIPRTERGKYRFLVQKLPVGYTDNGVDRPSRP
jgi:phenylacetate-CoA ligase